MSRSGNERSAHLLQIVGRAQVDDAANGELQLFTDRTPVDESFALPVTLFLVSVPLTSALVDANHLASAIGQRPRQHTLAWSFMWAAAAPLLAEKVPDWHAASADAAVIDRYLLGLSDLILQLMIDVSPAPESQLRFIRIRADAMIATESDDIGLAPTRIAARLGVSLRTLHRAYEGSPGVAHELRRHRVDRAAVRLLQPALNYLPIAEIAARSGFASLPTFNRAFVEIHGISPHRYRLGGGERSIVG